MKLFNNVSLPIIAILCSLSSISSTFSADDGSSSLQQEAAAGQRSLIIDARPQKAIFFGSEENGLDHIPQKPLCAVMAGTASYIKSQELGGLTYGRTYEESIVGDNLRNDITSVYMECDRAEITGIIEGIIEKYISGHSCASQVGSFSEMLKEATAFNCMEYALSTYKPTLLEKIQALGVNFNNRNDWWRIIRFAFTCVLDEPRDGDFVVYYNKDIMDHFGIFRASEQNASQGTVESQWGQMLDPWRGCVSFVYRTPVFCTPKYYGQVVKFYRLKDNLDDS